jgi:hypothetical protein
VRDRLVSAPPALLPSSVKRHACVKVAFDGVWSFGKVTAAQKYLVSIQFDDCEPHSSQTLPSFYVFRAGSMDCLVPF